MDVVLMAGVHQ